METYKEFLELDNVIIKPHIGASTIENQINSGKMAVQILMDVLDGKPGAAGKVV